MTIIYVDRSVFLSRFNYFLLNLLYGNQSITLIFKITAMKKKNILLVVAIIFVVLSNAYAQEFAPVGTKWTYGVHIGEATPVKNSPFYLEVKEEVQIKDKTCKAIEKTDVNGSTKIVDYIYQSGSKVFFYSEELDDFLLLFDFGAKVDDVLQIGVNDEGVYEDVHFVDLRIDSIGSVNYCGEELKVWYVSIPENAEGEPSVYDFNGKIIERIGFLSSFHPVYSLYCADWGSIRCFDDSEHSCKFVDYDCDTTFYILSTENIDISDNVSLYPNPTNRAINVTLPQIGKFYSWAIYNFDGKKIRNGRVPNADVKTFKIESLEDLDAGIYYLRLFEKADNSKKSTENKAIKFMKY